MSNNLILSLVLQEIKLNQAKHTICILCDYRSVETKEYNMSN